MAESSSDDAFAPTVTPDARSQGSGSEPGTLATIGVATLAIVVGRHALINAERRLMLQTWTLRQLIPNEARAPGLVRREL